MVYGTVGITVNLCHFAVFDIDQNTAAAVTHPAMAFNHRIILVNFHLASDVAISEFRHRGTPFDFIIQIGFLLYKSREDLVTIIFILIVPSFPFESREFETISRLTSKCGWPNNKKL
jgi:hypothetical protein